MIIDRIEKFYRFVESCKNNNCFDYKLTRYSDVSPFALVFAIFNYNFVGKISIIKEKSIFLKKKLEKNLRDYKEKRRIINNQLDYDKPYLQLLCFTLSSLYLLKEINQTELDYEIKEIFSNIRIEEYLKNIKAFEGKPGSGNLSMFYAIILLHKINYFNFSLKSEINLWVDLHLSNINKNGFWGSSLSNPYLQFQNGYHQYEIFNFLKIKYAPWDKASNFVQTLSDRKGQFAPYPGGGGCYDFDAIFFLTSRFVESEKYKKTLLKTRKTLINYANNDFGYCESKFIRPRTLENFFIILRHIWYTRNEAKFFSIRRNINLLLNKNNRINTHWTSYQRDWNESNLWDSWFRYLTIIKIEKTLGLLRKEEEKIYQFIDYPGIGYENFKQ